MDNEKMQMNLQKANNFIQKNKQKVFNTPYRLKYHFMPPIGWMNDPNGFIQYEEEYHLFYQHYPYDAKWGPMHWGHAKSKDLIHWEHLPVALAPSASYDSGNTFEHGCFSGSSIKNNNNLFVIYTGHSPEQEPMQVQCLAYSSDGVNFKKSIHNPVINKPPISGSQDFRDPYVWEKNDEYFMIIGTGKDNKGKVVLYKSKDMYTWSYKNVLAQSDGTQGSMWECPSLFQLGDNYALIISPMYGKKNSKPIIIQGEMDFKENKFNQKTNSRLDYGEDFYAPQVLSDNQNRQIMIGWMDIWFSNRPSEKDGWVGAMTIPRELKKSQKGGIIQKPIEELKKLRENYKNFSSFSFKDSHLIKNFSCNSAELILSFDLQQTTAEVFGITVRSSLDNSVQTVIKVDKSNAKITMDRNKSGTGEKGISTAPFNRNPSNTLLLRIFIDISSIELFINDGEQVITNRIFPGPEDNKVGLFSKDGEVVVNNFESWEIKSIWNTM